jgi:hypothetical protein
MGCELHIRPKVQPFGMVVNGLTQQMKKYYLSNYFLTLDSDKSKIDSNLKTSTYWFCTVRDLPKNFFDTICCLLNSHGAFLGKHLLHTGRFLQICIAVTVICMTSANKNL